MITVKGTRTGPGAGAAADIYRTHDEKPAARLVAMIGAGLAGAIAYFAAGTTGAEAEPEAPPPKPPAQDAGDAPAPEPIREASPAADGEEEPPPHAEAFQPAVSAAEAPAADPAGAIPPARVPRLGPPPRAPSEEAPEALARAEHAPGPVRLKALPREQALGGGSDEEDEQDDRGEDEEEAESPAEDDGEDETARNRAPRVGDPVSLPGVLATQAVFIPIASLLAGASDPDAQELGVTDIEASAGQLIAVDGGWIYLAPPGGTDDVVLTYTVSDGLDGVPQRALFDMLPDAAGTGTLDVPETFAILPAQAQAGRAPFAEDASVAEAGGQADGTQAPTQDVAAETPPDAAVEDTPPADAVAATETQSTPAPATSDVALAPEAPAPVVEAAPLATTQPPPVDGAPTAPTAFAAAETGQSEAAAPVSPADGGTTQEAKAAATEADSFVFPPSEPFGPAGAAGDTADLDVGDRVEPSASGPADAGPDQQFAQAYDIPGDPAADASDPQSTAQAPLLDPETDAPAPLTVLPQHDLVLA